MPGAVSDDLCLSLTGSRILSVKLTGVPVWTFQKSNILKSKLLFYLFLNSQLSPVA